MNDTTKFPPTPACICEACFHDERITHPLCFESPVLVAYCKHSRTGAFINLLLRPHRWTMFSPVDETGWNYMLQDRICDALEEDFAHCFDNWLELAYDARSMRYTH